ncbi:MAG: hypothetical protein ACQEQY_05465 [Halobacteriota archaeon]
MTDTDDEETRDAVPAGEIRELAAEFRERSDEAMGLGMIEASDYLEQCAKDLEGLLEG